MGRHRFALERLLTTTILGCVAGTTLFARAGDAPDGALPKYKLKVGQELVYRRADPPEESDDGQGGKNFHKLTFDWTVNVVRANDDGTWRLVFREKLTSVNHFRGNDRTQELLSDGYFDLSPAGQIVENATIQPVGDPTPLFPLLPSDEQSLANGWSTTLAVDETVRKFRASDGGPKPSTAECRFIEERQTILDPVYEMSERREYVFDLDRGLVDKAQVTTTQGWPKSRPHEPRMRMIELVEVRQLDAAQVASLDEQTRLYFTASDAYRELTRKANDDFRQTRALYGEAEARLKALDSQLTIPWLRELLANKLQQHERDAGFMIDDAERFAELLDKPSPDWQTTDLDGKPHALADYRGRVVVLDFWYRGCGWCIRAMPQIKQLTDDFAGQEVAVLGMNADREEPNARFIIDLMKLNYPTLKNGEQGDGVNSKYKIHGWPTLVVIDKQGVVRHMHFGYSPTLRRDMAEKIQELLAEK